MSNKRYYSNYSSDSDDEYDSDDSFIDDSSDIEDDIDYNPRDIDDIVDANIRKRKQTVSFANDPIIQNLYKQKCVYERDFNGNKPGDDSDTKSRIRKHRNYIASESYKKAKR